jgi:hypothetical protein
MPRGDGTGPMGYGPMTGRAAGYCAGYPMPGFANPIPGRGMGWGRGRGRGFGMGMGWRRGQQGWGYPPVAYPAQVGYGYGPAPSAQDETDALREQVGYYTEALESINKRLAELSAQTKEKK